MATVPALPRSFEKAFHLSFEVDKELERICQSSFFRSSKRSCEFLRYVVRVALDGRVDSLKERSIGIDLLGRDTSYDPSSDAAVRVRANEVRKRLASYYNANPATIAFRIDLPVGCYVPSFPPADAVPPPHSADLVPASFPLGTVLDPSESQPARPCIAPLGKLVLMRPSVLALLFCVLLLRQQLDNRDNLQRFWDHFLSGRTTMQFSVDPDDSLDGSLYPLIWVVGHYGVEASIGTAPLIVESPAQVASVRVARHSPASWREDTGLHWQFSGQEPHTAMLTILPEDSGTLYLQSSDKDALRKLCEELTSPRQFPSSLWRSVSSEKHVQLRIHQDAAGHWHDEIWPQEP
jgi:hypothetical protein